MGDYSATFETASVPDDVKDPDETLDFGFNWAPYLDGDTIVTCTFLLPDGLTSVSESNDTAHTSIFVSGGDEGRIYRITNRIITAAGRTLDRTMRILVTEQ